MKTGPQEESVSNKIHCFICLEKSMTPNQLQ
jgi:hypothetical protein